MPPGWESAFAFPLGKPLLASSFGYIVTLPFQRLHTLFIPHPMKTTNVCEFLHVKAVFKGMWWCTSCLGQGNRKRLVWGRMIQSKFLLAASTLKQRTCSVEQPEEGCFAHSF